jgi:hypothetical protein
MFGGFWVLQGCDNSTLSVNKYFSNVRVIHSCVNAGIVDIYAGNSLLFDNVSYRTATIYARLEAGETILRVTPSNDTASIVSFTALLDTNGHHTVVIPGSVSNFQGNGAGILVTDDTITVPAGNNMKLRFVHAFDSDSTIFNNTHINIHSGTDSTFIPNSGTVAVQGGMTYLSGSEYQIFAIPQTIKVTPYGNMNPIVQLTINGTAGKLYTVVVSGYTPAGQPVMDGYPDN